VCFNLCVLTCVFNLGVLTCVHVRNHDSVYKLLWGRLILWPPGTIPRGPTQPSRDSGQSLGQLAATPANQGLEQGLEQSKCAGPGTRDENSPSFTSHHDLYGRDPIGGAVSCIPTKQGNSNSFKYLSSLYVIMCMCFYSTWWR
jgi:hypothetical protein